MCLRPWAQILALPEKENMIKEKEKKALIFIICILFFSIFTFNYEKHLITLFCLLYSHLKLRFYPVFTVDPIFLFLEIK